MADEKLALENIFIATPFGYIALEAGWTVTEVEDNPGSFMES
jgi:cytochrome bd-type quinol oxidase subunit 1